MNSRLKKVLPSFENKNILVLGDIVLDIFTYGESKENPEHSAPCIVRNREEYTLGGAANVANNIASLNAIPYLFGVVGDDYYGKKLESICSDNHIGLVGFYDLENPTIVKQRIMHGNEQLLRLDIGEEKKRKIGKNIEDKVWDKLKQSINHKIFDFIIMSDYNKGFFTEKLSEEIIKLANSVGIRTLVDPKPCNINFFKKCTLICPNKHEAEKITNINYSANKNNLIKIGEKLSEIVASEYVVITCGEDGTFSYCTKTKKYEFVQTVAKKVYDVTGAGDTFAATLALGLSSGLPIHDASRLANYAAGIVVEKPGTAVPTLSELRYKL